MKLGRFLTTLGIGALVGMLLAPKKGSELREELKDKGKETLDSAKEMTVEDYQKLVKQLIVLKKQLMNLMLMTLKIVL